jgi:uncharacterized BrkB/YihY/UPF0761 family membrane protein
MVSLMAIKHRQIPAPGTIFFTDMILFQGEKAVNRGRTIVVAAFVTIVLSLIGAIYFSYYLGKLAGLQNNQKAVTTSQNR